MLKNRLLYLAALVAATVFYGFFYAWFSEFLVILLLVLPVFSLVISLPAMLTLQPKFSAPGSVFRAQEAQLHLVMHCPLPQPRCRFSLRVRNRLTEKLQVHRLRPRSLHLVLELPTAHCGCLSARLERVWVYDYLGLFRLPRRWKPKCTTLITPLEAAPERMPPLNILQAFSCRPKPGGGFAEIHELRDYRPGDSLRQIHWKLTAKADRPIVREPQEQNRGAVVLTLDLRGTEERMDLIMDRTCYLSRWLLANEVPHEVHWISGSVPLCQTVSTSEHLRELAVSLCSSEKADRDLDVQELVRGAAWHYHVSLPTGGAS